MTKKRDNEKTWWRAPVTSAECKSLSRIRTKVETIKELVLFKAKIAKSNGEKYITIKAPSNSTRASLTREINYIINECDKQGYVFFCEISCILVFKEKGGL